MDDVDSDKRPQVVATKWHEYCSTETSLGLGLDLGDCEGFRLAVLNESELLVHNGMRRQQRQQPERFCLDKADSANADHASELATPPPTRQSVIRPNHYHDDRLAEPETSQPERQDLGQIRPASGAAGEISGAPDALFEAAKGCSTAAAEPDLDLELGGPRSAPIDDGQQAEPAQASPRDPPAAAITRRLEAATGAQMAPADNEPTRQRPRPQTGTGAAPPPLADLFIVVEPVPSISSSTNNENLETGNNRSDDKAGSGWRAGEFKSGSMGLVSLFLDLSQLSYLAAWIWLLDSSQQANR